MADHQPIPWTVPDKRFTPLQVPRKGPAQEKRGYRVYKAKTEFVEVEAETIADALQKSGIAAPIRLERIGIATPNIFHENELAHLSGYGGEDKMQQAMEQTIAEKKAEAPAAEATPAS